MTNMEQGIKVEMKGHNGMMPQRTVPGLRSKTTGKRTGFNNDSQTVTDA